MAIDGTKANASRHKAMSYERRKQGEAELKAQIDPLLARVKAADEAEVNESEPLPMDASVLQDLAYAKAYLENSRQIFWKQPSTWRRAGCLHAEEAIDLLIEGGTA